MLGLFGPKSDKIGAHRAALAYQGPFKKDFSTGFRVINKVVLERLSEKPHERANRLSIRRLMAT
jgi:hypothetical protein